MDVYPLISPPFMGRERFFRCPKNNLFNKKFPKKNCSIIKVETLPTLTFLRCIYNFIKVYGKTCEIFTASLYCNRLLAKKSDLIVML